MYLYSYFIVLCLGLFVITGFKMQNRGYTAEGIKKILGNPTDYLYSISITTNTVAPLSLVPNSVAKTVKTTISSPDGWFALSVCAGFTLGVLSLIFALSVFFGRTAEGGGARKSG